MINGECDVLRDEGEGDGEAGGYATCPALALSGSARPSWLREVMSSLPNTLRRW